MSLCDLFDKKDQSKHYVCGTKFAFEDVTHKAISNYVFEDVQLNNIDFTDTNFTNVTFINCTFKKGLFCKGDLYNVIFERCRMFETDMTYAIGKNITFNNTIVQETDFSSTTLFGVKALESVFTDCYCHHSLFIDSRFAECVITGLDSLSFCIEGTEIVGCKNSNLSIEEIKFQDTIIRRA